MFQWTERFQHQQDWITVIIILVFMICVHLYSNNKHQFKLLISLWNIKSYFNIYDKEKFTNPLNKFNLILTFISLITFSLLVYFFYCKILLSTYGDISFFTFSFMLSSLIIFRYWILKLIFQYSSQLKLYHHMVFRSISFYGSISLYALFIITFYYYIFYDNNDLLFIVVTLILCLVYLSHLTIYIGIVQNNPNSLVYLILYLCAFKIAPWLWLYKSIY